MEKTFTWISMVIFLETLIFSAGCSSREREETSCTPGELNCQCAAENQCNTGLVCNAQKRCIEDENSSCTPGELNCQCAAENQCNTGLVCNIQNLCVEDTSSPDPEDANRISGYIDTLPWGPEEIDAAGKRDEFIDAVMKSCAEFMPSDGDWQIWCQAFLVAAACRESSLDVEYIDEWDPANPTVGLLQVDFYFAVQEFDGFGNKEVLARCGCEWPDFSSVDWDNDAWDWVDWMQDVYCNVAVGSWYYFRNATTNGGPNACFVECACQGDGTPANLAIGMLSHFAGPAAALNLFTSGDYEEHTYYTWVKEWFDDMILPTPSPHPFLRELQPDISQFCGN